MAAARHVVITLDPVDHERIALVAHHERTTATALLERVITSWVAGPGRDRLITALACERRGRHTHATPKPPRGQLELELAGAAVP